MKCSPTNLGIETGKRARQMGDVKKRKLSDLVAVCPPVSGKTCLDTHLNDQGKVKNFKACQ